MNLDGSHRRTLGLALLGLGLVLPFVIGLSEAATTAVRLILPLPVLWLGARRTFRLMRSSWREDVATTDGPIFVLSLLLLGLAVAVSYPIARLSGALDPGTDSAAVYIFPVDVLLWWAGALFMIEVSPGRRDRVSAPPSH